MNWLNRLLLLFICTPLFFVPEQLNAEDVVQLNSVEQLILIGSQVSYLEDPDGSLEIADLLSSEYHDRFIDHDKDVFSRPGTKSAFWFKISMQNHSSEDAWLEVGSNYAWYVDFYAPDSAGHYGDPVKTGTMRPDSAKLYDVNFFWLPLNKAYDDSKETYYLKVVSGLTYELPLQIGTIRSLSSNKMINDFLTAGFIGILLIMLLYNLFIYISTKDHIYVFYLGYLLLMAISMPYANGYPFIEKIDLLFFDKQLWNTYFLVWHTPAYYFVGAFCIRYLNLKSRGPKIRRLIQFEILIIAGVFPLLNILGFKFVELVNAVQVSIITLYLTCLVTGYYYVFKGLKPAYYYVIGWSFLISGAFIFFAVINGFLPFNPFSRNALYFGTTIEVCLFSLALANRLNEWRNEKDMIKSENLRLIKNQNELLEKEVQKRTEALESINRDLSKSNEILLHTTDSLNVQTEKLKKVNKTKDRLFAIISHDLRSPINSLKGLLELIHSANVSKRDFLKYTDDARKSVEHLHFMLNNLLNWAQYQLQGMTTKPEPIQLQTKVEENLQLFSDLYLHKQITVENRIHEDAYIYADRDHLDVIIRNMLSNSIKFTSAGGSITFSAEKVNGHCDLTITDTGTGIDQDQLQDLFTIKSGGSKPGTIGEKGTGLGLPLCKDFIEKNNGKILVESEKGQGTTFHISLPSSTK